MILFEDYAKDNAQELLMEEHSTEDYQISNPCNFDDDCGTLFDGTTGQCVWFEGCEYSKCCTTNGSTKRTDDSVKFNLAKVDQMSNPCNIDDDCSTLFGGTAGQCVWFEGCEYSKCCTIVGSEKWTKDNINLPDVLSK